MQGVVLNATVLAILKVMDSISKDFSGGLTKFIRFNGSFLSNHREQSHVTA